MDRTRPVAGILGAALLLVSLPALAVAQNDSAIAAENVQWSLTEYHDGSGLTDMPEGVETTLIMVGGDASGNAGCNSYFGSYEIDASSLSFGEFGVTAAICESPAQDVEDAYLPLLGSVATWAVGDAGLSLSDANETVILVYEETPITVTASDVVALETELASINAEIVAIQERFDVLRVQKLRNRVAGIEGNLDSLQDQVSGQNVPRLRERVQGNEAALNQAIQRLDTVRNRVGTLERQVKLMNRQINNLDKRLQGVEGSLNLEVTPLPSE